MIIVKAGNKIINLGNVQGIYHSENYIIFDLPEGQAYNVEYSSEEEAKAAFDKLFMDLAETPGVEGAILDNVIS